MKIRLLLAAALGLFFVQSAIAGKGLVVSEAWVREGPPNAPALGGFMVMHNHSDKVKTLVSASADEFGAVELHRTMMHGDMMKMVPQDKVEIPAHGMLSFKPGDYHIMLMKPKKALKAGDHVMVTLGFADGSRKKVKYLVKKGAGKGMNHDHQMHHGDHEGHDMQHKH